MGEKGLKIGRGKGVKGENDVGEKGLKIRRGKGVKENSRKSEER